MTTTANPELLTGLGAALSIFLTSVGAAVASVPAAKYALRSSGVLSFAPIIISGVLAVYGIIVSVLLAFKMQGTAADDAVSGYKNISAGLSVGLACLASGMGMARFLDQSVVEQDASGGTQEEPLIRGRVATKMLATPSIRFLMVMTFLEAIGLYGLIVALVLINV